MAQPFQSNNEIYRLVKEWHVTSFNQPESVGVIDIAIDSVNNVYVLDGNNNLVQKFDSGDNFVAEWQTYGKGGYYDEDEPTSIAIDSFDDIYILDSHNSRVQKFDSNGNFIMVWGSIGTGDKQFSKPTDMTIDSADNIYISDAGNNRVQKFDKDGNLIGKFGIKGREDGQFLYPVGLAVDSSGNVYTLESQKAAGLASGNNRVQKFDSNGTFITKWGSLGNGDGQFETSSDISIDSNDMVYVGDMFAELNYTSYDSKYYNKIQKFDSNGTFITKLDLGESKSDYPYIPLDFYVSKSGNIYSFDRMDEQIQIFIVKPSQTQDNKLNGGGASFFEYSDNNTTINGGNNVRQEIHVGITDQI